MKWMKNLWLHDKRKARPCGHVLFSLFVLPIIRFAKQPELIWMQSKVSEEEFVCLNVTIDKRRQFTGTLAWDNGPKSHAGSNFLCPFKSLLFAAYIITQMIFNLTLHAVALDSCRITIAARDKDADEREHDSVVLNGWKGVKFKQKGR